MTLYMELKSAKTGEVLAEGAGRTWWATFQRLYRQTGLDYPSGEPVGEYFPRGDDVHPFGVHHIQMGARRESNSLTLGPMVVVHVGEA